MPRFLLEETKEIQITEKTELEVRLNKKIKVWVPIPLKFNYDRYKVHSLEI